MTRLLTAAALALALTVVACGGESAEDKAQSKVCSARADIKKQVDELKSTTISSGSLEGVQANLSAIQKDVKQIADKPGQADGRPQAGGPEGQPGVQVGGVGRGRGGRQRPRAGNAEQQIRTAVNALASRYQGAAAVRPRRDATSAHPRRRRCCCGSRRRRPPRRRSTTGRSRTRGSRSSGRRRRARSCTLQLGLIANQSGLQKAVKAASNPSSSSYGKYPSLSTLAEQVRRVVVEAQGRGERVQEAERQGDGRRHAPARERDVVDRQGAEAVRHEVGGLQGEVGRARRAARSTRRSCRAGSRATSTRSPARGCSSPTGRRARASVVDGGTPTRTGTPALGCTPTSYPVRGAVRATACSRTRS